MRKRRGDTSKKTYDIDVSGVNTRIMRTFSKFAVERHCKGEQWSTEYRL